MSLFSGNLVGRFGWAAVSDKIGRRATFNIFTLGSVPIFALTPYLINQVRTVPIVYFFKDCPRLKQSMSSCALVNFLISIITAS